MKWFLTFLAAAALAGCVAPAQSLSQGDLTVTLASDPAPPLAGRPATMELTLRQAGQPLEGAHATMQRRMPGMEHESDHDLAVATDLGDGRYSAPLSFTMGGSWEIVVMVGEGDTQPQPVTFTLEVEQP